MTTTNLGIRMLGVELVVAAQGLQLHHASTFHHRGTYGIEQVASSDQSSLIKQEMVRSCWQRQL